MNLFAKVISALLFMGLLTGQSVAKDIDLVSHNGALSFSHFNDEQNNFQQVSHHVKADNFQVAQSSHIGSIVWHHNHKNNYKESQLSNNNISSAKLGLLWLLFAPVLLTLFSIEQFIKTRLAKTARVYTSSALYN